MSLADPSTPQDLVELEIGAFMGPHIKRARIVLVLVGVLYAATGFFALEDVVRSRVGLRHLQMHAEHADLAALERAINLAYASVIFVICAGIANLVLAAIAGRRTMFAFYAAMAIFVAHSAFQLYLSGGALITSVVWWLTAICLGLGFQAARKAERLRTSRPAG